MLLITYLKENTLINNTYNMFDYNIFTDRFITRFGMREIRGDVPVENIANMAQNTVDVYQPFLSGLFKSVINPLKSWNENGTSSGTSSGSRNNKVDTTDNKDSNGTITDLHTGTIDRTDTGTVTNEGTQKETGTGTTTDNNTVQRFVNAYNTPETASPESNDKTDATAEQNTTADTTTDTTETRNLNNKETRNYTDERTQKINDTSTGTSTTDETTSGENSETYEKSGFNTEDYFRLLSEYYNAIDYLIDLIARDILVTIPC